MSYYREITATIQIVLSNEERDENTNTSVHEDLELEAAAKSLLEGAQVHELIEGWNVDDWQVSLA